MTGNASGQPTHQNPENGSARLAPASAGRAFGARQPPLHVTLSQTEAHCKDHRGSYFASSIEDIHCSRASKAWLDNVDYLLASGCLYVILKQTGKEAKPRAQGTFPGARLGKPGLEWLSCSTATTSLNRDSREAHSKALAQAFRKRVLDLHTSNARTSAIAKQKMKLVYTIQQILYFGADRVPPKSPWPSTRSIRRRQSHIYRKRGKRCNGRSDYRKSFAVVLLMMQRIRVQSGLFRLVFIKVDY